MRRYSDALPDLTPFQWLLAGLGAFGIGLSKAGLAGVGLFHVVVFAFLFGARQSTGVVLPMLLAGDITAVTAFHQHARWDYIRRMLAPACLGVTAAAVIMGRLDDSLFKPVIGWIIMALTILQVARMLRPGWFASAPHSRGFAWVAGFFVGIATMMANAAGPIFGLYTVCPGVAETRDRRHRGVVLLASQRIQGAVQLLARADSGRDPDAERPARAGDPRRRLHGPADREPAATAGVRVAHGGVRGARGAEIDWSSVTV